MPNHVKNVITFTCPQNVYEGVIKELSAPGRDGEDDYVIDFNKVIPMPEALNITSGSKTGISIAAARFLEGRPLTDAQREYVASLKANYETDPEMKRSRADFRTYLQLLSDAGNRGLDLELGHRGSENLDRYGCATWYDWRLKHWGTKWNSYEGGLEEEGVSFCTAWSAPEPVLNAIAKRYPQASFNCLSVDESDDMSYTLRVYEKGRLKSKAIIEDPDRIDEIWGSGAQTFNYQTYRMGLETYRNVIPADFKEKTAAFLAEALPGASDYFRSELAQKLTEAARGYYQETCNAYFRDADRIEREAQKKQQEALEQSLSNGPDLSR